MKAVTYRTLWANEELRELEGFPTGVPGLAVGPHHPDDDVTGFGVVHLRSGALVAWQFASPEAALAAAHELGRLAADWTKTGSEMREYVRQSGFSGAVRDIATRYGGWTNTNPCRGDVFPDNGVIA